MIEADGWETVYQTAPSTDPAVGVTYTYRSYLSADYYYWRDRTVTIAEVFPDRWARDTNGAVWDFNTGGFIRVPK